MVVTHILTDVGYIEYQVTFLAGSPVHCWLNK